MSLWLCLPQISTNYMLNIVIDIGVGAGKKNIQGIISALKEIARQWRTALYKNTVSSKHAKSEWLMLAEGEVHWKLDIRAVHWGMTRWLSRCRWVDRHIHLWYLPKFLVTILKFWDQTNADMKEKKIIHFSELVL